MFPLVEQSRTRGHSCRLRGDRFKTEMRGNYFSQRVVNLWNSLPHSVVESESFQEGVRYISDLKNESGDMGNRWGGGFETRDRSALI